MYDFLDSREHPIVSELGAWLNTQVPALEAMDETDEFPTALADKLWDFGVLSLALPGGPDPERPITTLCAVIEEIARFSGGLSLLAVVQATGTLPVVLGAAPELQQRYFDLIRQRHYMAFALSETRAGSDARAIDTKIVDRGDHFEVSGSKWFATNGGMAHHMVIFGRHIQGGEDTGYTTVVVDRDTPGVTIAPKNDLFGMRGVPTNSVIMKRARVPKENTLGAPAEGFKLAMRTLDRSRPLIGAQAVGLARAALDVAVNHCRKRQVFGKSLGQLDGVRMMLADMSAAVDASRLLVYRAAAAVDAGHPEATRFSSAAKFFATDTAMQVSVDAIQILGGYGCFRGRTLDRIMRDAKITQIYEGANQIQRIVVGRDLLNGPRVDRDGIVKAEDAHSHRLQEEAGADEEQPLTLSVLGE